MRADNSNVYGSIMHIISILLCVNPKISSVAQRYSLWKVHRDFTAHHVPVQYWPQHYYLGAGVV